MKISRILASVIGAVFTYCSFFNVITTSKVSADEAIRDFDPEVFYHEILNEKRPEYAKSYRFLDLDNDGFEELLIYEGYVIAVYTVDKSLNQPKIIFSQSGGGFPHYLLCNNGFVKTRTNWRGEINGNTFYKIIDGDLEPVIGYYLYNGKYLKTDNKEYLSTLLIENFNKWDDITTEVNAYSSLDLKGRLEKYEENNNVSLGLLCDELPIWSEAALWTYSFSEYDHQREFEKNYKAAPLSVCGRYAYDEFLQRYKDYISAIKYEDMSVGSIGTQYLSTDKYSEELRSYIYEKSSEHCFILRDLNGDGIRELVTGGLEENGDFRFFDLYTLYDNKIIHLAASAANHRNIFYLNKDDEIVLSLFGGAANNSKEVYSISKGALKLEGIIKMEAGQYYNYENFGTVSENKVKIDQNKYNKIIEEQYKGELKQDVIMLKDWHPGMRINEDPDGDANDDGEINIRDVILVHKHILSVTGETVVDTAYADINKDNTINVLDLMLLKKLIVTQ